MRLAISGSRNWPYHRRGELIIALSKVIGILEPEGFEIGDANGVDTLLYNYLTDYRRDVNRHEAYWNKLGKGAGHERNSRVLLNADALFAAPLGEAKGTNNCINQALKKGMSVYVYQDGEVKLHG